MVLVGFQSLSTPHRYQSVAEDCSKFGGLFSQKQFHYTTTGRRRFAAEREEMFVGQGVGIEELTRSGGDLKS